MGWGGARSGAGRKAKPKDTVPAAPKPSGPLNVYSPQAIAAIERVIEMSGARRKNRQNAQHLNPFQLPKFPTAAMPSKASGLAMAMDESMSWAAAEWAGAMLGATTDEGLLFLGYPYLSELAQIPEYRVFAETIADDATRKWIDFDVVGDLKENRRRAEKDPAGEEERMADPDERKKRVDAAGKTDKVKALKDDQLRLEVRDQFYMMSRDDSFFGRTHLFLDFGTAIDGADGELKTPIGDGRDVISKGKVAKNSFRRLQSVEPVWVYPTTYNATNPLAKDWYNPQVWYVMGKQIHCSRLLKFVGREVPDMLKPAYAFGGLSLSQLAKPYVDIWRTTRQSVGDLIHAFSVMVLHTDLQTILQPGGADALLARAALFNALRDNQGIFMVNNASEDFKNVSVPLSGLHELQSQSQEHMFSAVRIPLVKGTGIQPAGLNASSEGEIKVYDDTIVAYQNRLFGPNLTKVINFEQLSLWGEVDPEITYRFETLRELTDKERGEKEEKDSQRDERYVNMGALSPDEIRGRIIDDPDLPYADLDPDDVPEPPIEEDPAGSSGGPGKGLLNGGNAPDVPRPDSGKSKNDGAGET